MSLDAIQEMLDKALEGDSPDLRLEDFYAIMPMAGSYLYVPTREIWPASSVNARIKPIKLGRDEVRASAWLARSAADWNVCQSGRCGQGGV
jgi:hypothetical protein